MEETNRGGHGMAWHSQASGGQGRLGGMCKPEVWMQEWLTRPLDAKAVPWLAARDGQPNVAPEVLAASAGPRGFWHGSRRECRRGWSTPLPPLQQEERSAPSQVNPLICQGLTGVGPCSPSFEGGSFGCGRGFTATPSCLAMYMGFFKRLQV